jgi:hypothetical protein
MNVSSLSLALLLLVCGLSNLATAEEINRNADGTMRATYSIEDRAKEKSKGFDPLNRGVDMTLSKPSLTSAEKEKLFPEETTRRLQKEADRAKMTTTEKAKEKRMIDRVPEASKNKNPNLKELNSIPVR